MTHLIFSSVLATAIAVTSATAIARSRHYGAPATYSYNKCDPNAALAAGYVGYNPCNDPNAAFV
ncbi:MAG: hypothetical protein J2P54_25500, partial [Bradyrhizobiaceae bacterium]|nr:hypothetical protein [Bradyrhizobiaceae bacterium]